MGPTDVAGWFKNGFCIPDDALLGAGDEAGDKADEPEAVEAADKADKPEAAEAADKADKPEAVVDAVKAKLVEPEAAAEAPAAPGGSHPICSIASHCGSRKLNK